ncbi:MAG: helix-turn-helix transcriptional regulator [Clostridia bacterium]|nr:helix-turn-helix transcriptional regulator [Clostridia bacterium]
MFRLKELRTDRKITQKELSSILGVSPALIGFYENEINHPAPNMLIKIADFFGCSVDYLLGREDDFGIISSANSEEENLTELERELVDLFRALPELRQETMLDSLRGMVALQEKRKRG